MRASSLWFEDGRGPEFEAPWDEAFSNFGAGLGHFGSRESEVADKEAPKKPLNRSP